MLAPPPGWIADNRARRVSAYLFLRVDLPRGGGHGRHATRDPGRTFPDNSWKIARSYGAMASANGE
jgi:hypothetical protein